MDPVDHEQNAMYTTSMKAHSVGVKDMSPKEQDQ